MARPWLLAAAAPAYWNLKRLIILAGTAFSLIGSLGGQFYVDPVSKRGTDLDARIKDVTARAETLRAADTQYWNVQAQSAIVFGLKAAATADDTVRDNLLNLHKLATANRRAAMIPIVGGLALAGEVPYRETSDRLSALAKAEQADFTWDNFQAANNFERDLVMKAERRVGDLQTEGRALTQEKVAVDAEAERRKLVLLSILTLASTFLLVANLLSTREGGEERVAEKRA